MDSESSVFLSDRVQLENARIQRNKRLRPEASAKSVLALSEPLRKIANLNLNVSGTLSTPAEDLFWNGELRQTPTTLASLKSVSKATFGLHDVLGKKSDLAFAILSSHKTNEPWIYSHIDPTTPVVLIGQHPGGKEDLKEILPNWWRTTNEIPLDQNGNPLEGMHMKFMVLFYKSGRVRVVITSANLTEEDWAVAENSVWLQDIPRLDTPNARDTNRKRFVSQLENVLVRLSIPRVLDIVKASEASKADSSQSIGFPLHTVHDLGTLWDFSKVQVQMVASVPGSHHGWPNILMYGHTRLMEALLDMGMRTGKDKNARKLVLECQGTVVSQYTTQWLNEFHWSARGESPGDWLDKPQKPRQTMPLPPIKILYPSDQNVRSSVQGPSRAGGLACRLSAWNTSSCPKQLFHDLKTKSGAAFLHSSMMIGTLRSQGAPNPEEDTDSDFSDDDEATRPQKPTFGWAYIGSHNLTSAAWGIVSGSAFSPSIRISNYELGILVPLKSNSKANRTAGWERPVRRYNADVDVPWILDDREAD